MVYFGFNKAYFGSIKVYFGSNKAYFGFIKAYFGFIKAYQKPFFLGALAALVGGCRVVGAGRGRLGGYVRNN